MIILQAGTYISKSKEWKIKIRHEKRRWSYQVQPNGTEFNGVFQITSKKQITETLLYYLHKL